MLKAIFSFAVLFVASTSAFAQSWNPQKSATVSSWIGQVVPGATPSLAIGVAINGNLVLAQGFGYARPGVPAGPDTVYHIGSVTKQFTAAAIVRMAEQGVTVPFTGQPFGLDASVHDFFANATSWGNVSIRQLLTMTSGLPNYTWYPPAGLAGNQPVTWQNLLAGIKTYPSNQFAGFFYSNTNYFLLAQTLEVLANNNGGYNDIIRTQILSPLGMTSSGFIGDYAPGCVVADFRAGPFGLPDWPKGAGNIASTINDLHKWNNAFFGGQVVSPQSVRMMTSQWADAGGGQYYGMGWLSQSAPNATFYFHAGEVSGFSSFNGIYAGGGTTVAVTILANADGVPNLEKLFKDVVNLAFQ
jgi:D-alanyl-D-alanine carboxypeptidase